MPPQGNVKPSRNRVNSHPQNTGCVIFFPYKCSEESVCRMGGSVQRLFACCGVYGDKNYSITSSLHLLLKKKRLAYWQLTTTSRISIYALMS